MLNLRNIDAYVYRLCLDAGTLPEHCDTVLARASGLGRRDVTASLEKLVRTGVLRAIDTLWESAPAQSRRIDTLVIHTADRPALFRRCLSSVLPNAADRLVCVVDGSRDPRHARVVREHVRHASAAGHQLEYVGRREWQRRCRALSSPAAEEALRWLTEGPQTGYRAGAIRNRGLLCRAGERVMWVDDDTVWLPKPGPRGAGADVITVADSGSVEWRFFATREEAIDARAPSDGNLVAAHERVLGWSPGARGQRIVGSPPSADGARRASFLPCGPDTRVRFTMAGLAGDAAVWCPHRLLFAAGQTRRRLMDPGNLRLALTSREVVRMSGSYVITDQDPGMGYCTGLDLTSPVPPCAPAGLNEDGLFAWTLRLVDEGALICHVPHAVVHDSLRSSKRQDDTVRSAHDNRMSEILIWMARYAGLRSVGGTPSARQHALGAWLVMISSGDRRSFRSLVTTSIVRARAETLEAIEGRMQEDCSATFRKALQRYRLVLRRRLRETSYYVPLECGSRSVAEGMDAWQMHVRRLGEALLLWPDVWDAACRQRAR